MSVVTVELVDPHRLRDLMERRGKSVRGLAREVHVSPAMISHLRSKERERRVNLITALQIADALDTPPESLWRAPNGLTFAEAR